MTDVTLTGDPPIGIRLRRNGRARRLSLRVSGIDGRVTLTLPPHVSDREAASFVRSKERWLRSSLAKAATPLRVENGTVLPVEDRPRQVVISPSCRIAFEADRIAAPSVAAVAAGLKSLARDRVTSAVDRHASRLGRTASEIALRDTRSRWGSCSAEGRLMLSWRLIMAPPEVLDYVVAHEVAHLVRMDHSPEFWAIVERLYGDHRQARGWLRREGLSLHRWQFSD